MKKLNNLPFKQLTLLTFLQNFLWISDAFFQEQSLYFFSVYDKICFLKNDDFSMDDSTFNKYEDCALTLKNGKS